MRYVIHNWFPRTLDVEFKESDHPRASNGQFGSGSGGSSGSSSGHVAASAQVSFKKNKAHGVKELNGIPFKSWTPPKNEKDWATVPGQTKISEPEFKVTPGKRAASGVVITEADGRIWVVAPKDAYGGYKQTFPKGGIDEGLSPQANAIKEAYEESGLKVRITGYVGDFPGDTSVTRYYHAVRESGDPADAGWESEDVILAPKGDLAKLLNKKRDQDIVASLSSATPPGAGSSSGKLNPTDLTKIGGKMGSNEGGVFEDKSGHRYYVKRPQSKDHVKNEMAAARLYQLAGVNTLNYKEVEGGTHVATELVKLDKSNISKMSPEERREATKDFVIHAWLSNWDAAGTGGDNQGVVNGKVTTLDVGGSLRYRAQGGPKGGAFGDKVSEIDTMRNPSMSYDASKLYGKMSDSELRDSAKRVTQIPDASIKKAVGDDEALASTLIARKRDIAKRFGL